MFTGSSMSLTKTTVSGREVLAVGFCHALSMFAMLFVWTCMLVKIGG